MASHAHQKQVPGSDPTLQTIVADTAMPWPTVCLCKCFILGVNTGWVPGVKCVTRMRKYTCVTWCQQCYQVIFVSTMSQSHLCVNHVTRSYLCEPCHQVIFASTISPSHLCVNHVTKSSLCQLCHQVIFVSTMSLLGQPYHWSTINQSTNGKNYHQHEVDITPDKI